MRPVMRKHARNEIDEMLDDLDHNMKRLRIEYEQFFMGNMKREPQVLRGKVQKVITQLVNEPPRNSAQKFRFNSLNAKFQVYRQLWGRTMREIENGTHQRDKFRARLHAAPEDEPAAPRQVERKTPAKSGSSVNRLHEALLKARRKTGQHEGAPSPEALNRMVRKQMDAIRAKHGDVKVKFKVVIENNKAKLKAQVSK